MIKFLQILVVNLPLVFDSSQITTAKTGWSFYAKEGFSKGKEESEQRSYENSHLDSEHITLNSGKDT